MFMRLPKKCVVLNSLQIKVYFMKTNCCVLTIFRKTKNVKSFLWLGFITGACFVAPTASHAALSFIGNAYVELQANGGANNYYWADQSDGHNPQFTGSLLSIVQGQTLELGGQAQTYDRGTGTTVTMYYTINNYSTQPSFGLSYDGQYGNNDRWDTSGHVDIANGLSAGTYTLDVWYSANNGSTTLFDNNGGNNYSANFTVIAVPEPINVALGCFGALFAAAGMIRFLNSRSFNPGANQSA
jgi:hypothetical protein